MKQMRIFPVVLFCLLTGSSLAQEDNSSSDGFIPITQQQVPEPEPETVEEEEVFMIVETMPEFPGGQDAMFAFIDSNLVYPENLSKAGISGLVFVQFVITSTGAVDPDRIDVMRGVHPQLDQEAIEVIRKMPAWTPGKQRGKPVAVYMRYPIRFKAD